MMNFFNAIPENIGWMMAGGGLVISVLVFIDVIRMAVIGIKGRLEKDEDESPCPVCGMVIAPFEKNGSVGSYQCGCCGTQWSEEL